jgi:hypothetical protein
VNADPNKYDVEYMTERLVHHLHEFERASAEWDHADMRLKHKAHGDAVALRTARRDDQDRGDAYKAVDFHMSAVTMYATAITACCARLEAHRVAAAGG